MTFTMTPEQLLENFKNQQTLVAEELRKLEFEINTKKETYIKLQGAIEGIELLIDKQDSAVESTPEVVAGVLE
jgi:hypothetical protein